MRAYCVLVAVALLSATLVSGCGPKTAPQGAVAKGPQGTQSKGTEKPAPPKPMKPQKVCARPEQS